MNSFIPNKGRGRASYTVINYGAIILTKMSVAALSIQSASHVPSDWPCTLNAGKYFLTDGCLIGSTRILVKMLRRLWKQGATPGRLLGHDSLHPW